MVTVGINTPSSNRDPARAKEVSADVLLSRRASPIIQTTCDAAVKRKIAIATPLSTIGIAVAAFLLIAFLKGDVALVAIGAMLGGIIYSSIRGFA
jgi:hypothetical protein